MSGTPVEIHWFPRHTDRFLTWGSEINLYQVKNSDEVDHRISTSALFKILRPNGFKLKSIFVFFFRYQFGYIVIHDSHFISIRNTISIYSLCCTIVSKCRRFIISCWSSKWQSWIVQFRAIE